ncbi:MAG: response regulator [Oscillospiraceae bacterium]|nr:response regulator [Oscillospiraceae bacterium]
MGKEKILIVDDSEMNRSILADILGENYYIIEAEDGNEAVELLEKMHKEIDLVLLDIVMPNMDGFGVLNAMNEKHWIDSSPVIMVTAEREASQVERAYELGVTDFIIRPFDSYIVRHRVVNTLLLYAKQKRLMATVREQLEEKEKFSSTMIDILSHIVETRNGESGLHVLHVRAITDFLLRRLRLLTDDYPLTDELITLISNASALHDIGKMAIDESILNKPGRFTDEEYEIMKTHTTIGAKMLEGESLRPDDPLVAAAYEICRWHHERYDGRGYPDGLKGDEIPISAQVVALADVYDALTSIRVYKASYSHETAIEMILDGKCGTFNPLLLDCLRGSADDLKKKLEGNVAEDMDRQEIRSVTEAALSGKAGSVSERTLNLLDYERRQTEIEAESANKDNDN